MDFKDFIDKHGLNELFGIGPAFPNTPLDHDMSDFIQPIGADVHDDEDKDKYLYPDAGHNAPPGVQEEVKKFLQLSEKERGKRPLLYHILGSSTPDYKMSKEDSRYTDESEVDGETCGNCEFAYKKVVSGKFICSQIAGKIKPEGWCKLWMDEDGNKSKVRNT